MYSTIITRYAIRQRTFSWLPCKYEYWFRPIVLSTNVLIAVCAVRVDNQQSQKCNNKFAFKYFYWIHCSLIYIFTFDIFIGKFFSSFIYPFFWFIFWFYNPNSGVKYSHLNHHQTGAIQQHPSRIQVCFINRLCFCFYFIIIFYYQLRIDIKFNFSVENSSKKWRSTICCSNYKDEN